MTKIIFMLWLLSGKAQYQYDKANFLDYDKGRKLYVVDGNVGMYKGEVLNYIRTKQMVYNENFSDKNGRIVAKDESIGTLKMCEKGTTETKDFEVFKDRKGTYVIDKYFNTKIYIKSKN